MARCPFGTECFAERARATAGGADIVVTNHALLAIDAVADSAVLPEHQLLVVDEAHDLVDRVTAVAPANNRLRSSPATDSGATLNTARVEPRLSSWSSQTTSERSGIGGANDVSIRDAVSPTSVRPATASVRAEAALGSAGDMSITERDALAASRSAAR